MGKNEVPHKFFLASDTDQIVQAYRDIMSWVQENPQYSDRAKAKFAKGADGWLVAHALLQPATVVTNEQPVPNSGEVIKLPDVCTQFEAHWKDIFSMLGSLNIQF